MDALMMLGKNEIIVTGNQRSLKNAVNKSASTQSRVDKKKKKKPGAEKF